MDHGEASLARRLNVACECITTDDALLGEALAREGSALGVEALVASHPHLFSRSAVFVEPHALEAMSATIAAIERVVALPGYEARALEGAPDLARVATRSLGGFLGYDFHLADDGPKLIEINTNPGGALLNAVLRRAQRACCPPVAEAMGVGDDHAADAILATFDAEWRAARGDAPLRSVAIVDDAPASQYLYPEFVLFARTWERRGVRATIADAAALAIEGGRLVYDGEPIDLVYDRSTDFMLDEAAHAALATAFRDDLALVVPHPRAHALRADKRRLVTLSDAAALEALGAPPDDAARIAAHVPRTIVVEASLREALWRDRKRYFFKPAGGYGSKAAYRGDKITKGAFDALFEAVPYVAQELVPPSGRAVRVGDDRRELKVDVRCFAYAGRVLLVCARLYQGQTTNFRTAGGGFAPVYVAG